MHNYSAKGTICGLNCYMYQTAQMSIKLNGINCFYGAHQALFDITLDCPQGETLVLLGPSGAGKSSLLRVLASCARTWVWFSNSTICGRI